MRPGVLAGLVALCGAGALVHGYAQGPPTFSLAVDTVRIDALVTERGRHVRDLRVDEVEVFDSGVRQTVDAFSLDELPLNVVFALDASASVTGEQIAHLRDGARSVLSQLRDGDEAALVTFARSVTLRAALTPDLAAMRDLMDRLQPYVQSAGGTTALVDAVFAAMMVSERAAGRSLLLLFTDGVDTSSWLSVEKALEAARRMDVVVYAVGTSPFAKESFVRRLCEATGGEAVRITSTAALQAAFTGILDEFRSRYVIAFSPTGVAAGGWHPLTVRVTRESVAVRARAGYVR